MAIEFRVKRIETVTKQCRGCGGTGYNTVKHNGSVFKNKCHNYGCKEGKITAEKETDINLITALKELGLIQ